MPFEKYIIRDDDVTLGVKFDHSRNLAVIGGFKRFLNSIHTIVEVIFQSDPGDLKFPQTNKVKVTVEMNYKKFHEGIELMKEKGFAIQPVTRLENLMR